MSRRGPEKRSEGARPPLRKAPDATVHPSTPDPPRARSARGQSLVPLKVRVPKALRRSLRVEARRRGVTVDAIVAVTLQEHVAPWIQGR